MWFFFVIESSISELDSHFFLAVFAARLKLAAVGAPGLPGFRIFSPLPFLIRIRFAWMFA
jgi:hypothetical protein